MRALLVSQRRPLQLYGLYRLCGRRDEGQCEQQAAIVKATSSIMQSAFRLRSIPRAVSQRRPLQLYGLCRLYGRRDAGGSEQLAVIVKVMSSMMQLEHEHTLSRSGGLYSSTALRPEWLTRRGSERAAESLPTSKLDRERTDNIEHQCSPCCFRWYFRWCGKAASSISTAVWAHRPAGSGAAQQHATIYIPICQNRTTERFVSNVKSALVVSQAGR